MIEASPILLLNKRLRNSMTFFYLPGKGSFFSRYPGCYAFLFLNFWRDLQSVSQFLGSPGGGNHCIHQRQTESPLLHGIEAGHGCPPGGTDLIAKRGRMFGGGLD